MVNKLEVKLLNAYERSDGEIAQTATNNLKWNVLVPHQNIKIAVENGVVTGLIEEF